MRCPHTKKKMMEHLQVTSAQIRKSRKDYPAALVFIILILLFYVSGYIESSGSKLIFKLFFFIFGFFFFFLYLYLCC
jgi:hypothetical protein